MRTKLLIRQFFFLFCFLSLSLAACVPAQPTVVSTATPSPAPSIPLTEAPAFTATPVTGPHLIVAFVKDGNIQVWDEATGQTNTIFISRDVIRVTMRDDGQAIAFLRRSTVQRSETEWFEQSSLWAVDLNGGNPRELVSAESLRQRLNTAENFSSNIPQMEWIPGTHQLLFSGWNYFVQAEGESHAVPEGLFLVDTDALTDKVLISAGTNLRFVPSPDGQQIALMSLNGLSFINTDGNNLRTNIFTYDQMGRTGPLFPTGVWTQDSTAFLITGSLETDPTFNINFTIWRVPVDGASATALGTVTKSDPGSVTFSPDGGRLAFVQSLDGNPLGNAGWFITPLAGQVSPLAIPDEYDFASRNASLHWSPAGDPFTKNLKKLCPEATQDTDECDTRIYFYGTISAIRWIDGNKVLFLTSEPSVLFLATMDFTGNMDGTTIPIAAWPLNEWVSINSFTTAMASR